MDNIYYRQLLNHRVKIEPKYLSKDFRNYVLSKLKDMLEGVCSNHGYIKKDSIQLYKVSPGAIELVGLNGNVNYDVQFYAEVCNPLIGNVIRASVTNSNKFGILAEVGNILEIIIPKASVNIVHDIDPESVALNQQVIIEIVRTKYELNDKKISIVGRLVSGETSKKSKTKTHLEEEEEEEELYEEETLEEEEEPEQEDEETASQPASEHDSFFDSEEEEAPEEEDFDEFFSEEEEETSEDEPI